MTWGRDQSVRKELQISYRGQSGLPPVQCHRNRFSQAIGNSSDHVDRAAVPGSGTSGQPVCPSSRAISPRPKKNALTNLRAAPRSNRPRRARVPARSRSSQIRILRPTDFLTCRLNSARLRSLLPAQPNFPPQETSGQSSRRAQAREPPALFLLGFPAQHTPDISIFAAFEFEQTRKNSHPLRFGHRGRLFSCRLHARSQDSEYRQSHRNYRKSFHCRLFFLLRPQRRG